MLELKNISLSLDRGGEAHALLDDITFSIPSGHLLAIVGPSGCGKTTLLKTVAGLKHHDQGEIHWEGRNVEDEKDLHPSELGYVPQFSIAHDLLTVEECVASAVALRTCQPDDESAWALVETTLQQTGLTTLADRQVKVLSGGQRRRLGLAMELVTNPTLLLCDEVTSGLDPKSEREITQLLHDLAQNNPRRIVINVTHSLSNLSLFDTILVLHEGRVVYHGPPRALSHYFSVEQAEEIYPKLGRRSSERWSESWSRHRDAYYATYGLAPKKDETKGNGNGKESGTGDLKATGEREPDRIKLPSAASFPDDGKGDEKASLEKEEEDEGDDWSKYKKRHEKKQREKAKERGELPKESEEQHLPEISDDHRLPGILAQTRELLRRRWTIFWRDKTQLWLQLAMILGFPLLVVIFGLEPIPQVRKLSVRQDANERVNIEEKISFTASQISSGGVVSGLILMQVVLVTLMASNNAAREIAGERDILERERLGGLRATSYVLSKILFLGTFVLVQSLWMGLFVEMVCAGIPGDLLVKLLMLVMASAAMTSICLGISAMMRSPEKATILSIYLVGFQLPLSGALLALPKAIAPIAQFFIAAYWSWAGSLSSMKSTDFYDAVKVVVTTTNIEHWTTATFVLGLHVLVGLAFTYAGTKNSQWD